MKQLLSCDGGISGEHLISKSVIEVLKADGDFSVSGLPWLQAGENKVLGANNFTANCLCRRHNSMLSPLDDAARYFFAALKKSLDRETGALEHLVSGHDIERWLLKTAKALAVSGNLARGRERLSGAFASDIQVLDMLEHPTRWPERAGLYCVMNTNDVTQNHNRFQLAPYTNAQDELSGLGVNIMGLDFVLMLEPPNLTSSPQATAAKFRPSQIAITFAETVNRLRLCWEDGKAHNDILSLSHLGVVSS